MEYLEKRLQEQFVEAQHRVAHLEAQLHSPKEELCRSEASLELVTAMILNVIKNVAYKPSRGFLV